MRQRILSAFIFLFTAGAAAAESYTDAGGRYTAGPDGYAGMSAFAEWGDDSYYLRPALNTYKSDLSDRKSIYSFGAGLERERWSAGAELSLTPETAGYKNTGLYGDFTYRLLGEPADDAALEDLALGVFCGLTAHEDAYATSTTTVYSGRRGGSSSALTDAFKLNQTDYGVSASLKAFGLRASGRFTKTAYDKDVTEEARQLPIEIGGVGASGFPDTAVSVRLRVPGLPLSPEAGYAKTTYLLDQPSSEALNFGVSVRAGRAELSAGWENFNPGGGAGRSDYYSLGLTFSF
ncbi:MAG: hypothetical protein A2X32_07140 [Elusimicrobia bacterium GWC2_64_44]|nr:MAG: hypothetical protein A2X32_07140 [Elusimicrobia bacterium GWC2_64_44]